MWLVFVQKSEKAPPSPTLHWTPSSLYEILHWKKMDRPISQQSHYSSFACSLILPFQMIKVCKQERRMRVVTEGENGSYISQNIWTLFEYSRESSKAFSEAKFSRKNTYVSGATVYILRGNNISSLLWLWGRLSFSSLPSSWSYKVATKPGKRKKRESVEFMTSCSTFPPIIVSV